MNLANANFSLKKGSPAIAKGVDLTNFLLPYNWPKYTGSAPDIGAVPYQPLSIKQEASVRIVPSFAMRGFVGKNQVLIKTKQGNFSIRGERVKGGRSEVMGNRSWVIGHG